MVDLKRIARYLLAEGVYRSQFFTLLMRLLSRRHSLVLMYHRILPRNVEGPFLQPGMYVEPDTFERHLLFLKKYFRVLPSTAVYPVHYGDTADLQGRPSCVLTFDDGWADFYSYAFPLLVKHRVPATVFISTGFIGTTRLFWTERLALLCASALQRGTFVLMQNLARQLLPLPECVMAPVNIFQEHLIQCLKAYRFEDIEAILRQLSFFADIAPDTGRDFLNWQEIEEMQNSGLVTFGSHTENHLLLNTLTNEEIICELVNSKQALLVHCDPDVSLLSFCYPNGNFNAGTIIELDRAGYACAFTTRSGWNTSATPRFELKRVGIHQDIAASEALFAYRILFAARPFA